VTTTTDVGTPTIDDDTSGPSRWRRPLELALVVAPVALFGWLSWHARVLVDDGYIYLHIVQQIIAGNGPVYNVGQRVEVFTGPLWTFLLVPAVLVSPASMETTALVLGDLLAMAGLLLAARAARTIWRRQAPDAFLAPAGLLVPVAVYAYWWLSSSGLEVGLSLAWIGGSALIVAASGNRPDPTLRRAELVVLGLGSLIRPEFLLYSVILLLWYVVARRHELGPRRILAALAWAAALPVAYQVFRMGYYGEFVANTAIAKEATRPFPSRGLGYLHNFVGVYWLWVPLLCLTIGGLVPAVRRMRRNRASAWAYAPVVAVPLAGLLNIAYVTAIGGDYFAGRLLLPGTFAFIAPFAVLPVRRAHVVGFLTVVWAVGTAIAVRPVFNFAGLPYLTQPPSTTNTVNSLTWTSRGLHLHGTGSRVFVVDAFGHSSSELDVRPTPDLPVPTAVTGGIGSVAFAFGDKLNIFDLLGLANPIDAHLHLPKETGPDKPLPGHEKLLPVPWLIAMTSAPGTPISRYGGGATGIYYFTLSPNPFASAAGERALAVQVAWARATLRCPAVQAFVASYEAPLTVSRFVSNLVHAASNSVLRIDRDPERAYHQECGSGTPAGVRAALQAP
jgi:arabinofuranosyltransferase